MTISPIRDEGGNIIGASKIARDITERKHAEQALAKANRVLQVLSACNAMLIHATDEAELLDWICRLIVETGGYRMAWIGRAENNAGKIVRPVAWYGTGTEYLTEVKITWADDPWGQGPTGTAIRSGLVQVNQNSLTNLPNRRLLIDRLQVALAACTQGGHFGALFYVDLDNFKTINDTLGHALGDQLLKQVATRLSVSVTHADTVASLGGDDFFILLPDLGADLGQTETLARALGDRILACFQAPFPVGHAQCRATPSLGVALFGRPQDTVEDLLKQVDLAMYEAKRAGRNTLRFFDSQVQAAVVAEATLEADLRAALERREFGLYYQVQVDDSGKLIGAEALVRWQHPRRGLLAPKAFIGVAERTGLIVPIGAWVLEDACAQLAVWTNQPGMLQFTLAINVSAKQFRQPDFVDQCLEIFARTGVDPNRLKFEPTESLLLEDVDDTVAKMTALRAQGVRFALDDFGTGYSSLTYLRRLPLDQLKIDQSFVHDIPDESNACVIVRTIIVLGQSLGLAVIAEGVETEGQRDFLAANGCSFYQGYLYSRPLPLEEFEAYVKHM